MAPRSILLAVTGAPYEAELLARLDHPAGRVQVARRCLDLADLLAVASTGLARVALVEAGLRRLDRAALAQLAAAEVAVVAVMGPDDDRSRSDAHGCEASRLEDLGVQWVVASDADAHELVRVIDQAAAGPSGTSDHAFAVPWRPAAAPPRRLPVQPSEDEPSGPPGRLVAVWGPVGAPGRTSVAVGLADELVALDADVLLADADTYGPTIAQCLALLDEGSGLAAAARVAGSGSLSAEALAAHARVVRPGLRLLTGLSRPDRWPELAGPSLERVWLAARAAAAWVVVDCGFNLERDEELVHDTTVPRRNTATLTTLAAADDVLLVVSAEPLGVARALQRLADVRVLAPRARHRVVLTGVRPGPVGRRPEASLIELLARHGAPPDPVLVPYDRAGYDTALTQGRTLREVDPTSPARTALAALAAELVADQTVPRAEPPARAKPRRWWSASPAGRSSAR